ncbi:MAG: hypothetical protein HC903_14495 [Methylacidiphilales bacterium]|nr:hypothetical protein [Candidatus Methylacidiphilales bacterium]
MPINYMSNSSVSKQELNITPTSSITNFDSNNNDIYSNRSLRNYNSSSYSTIAKSALNPITQAQVTV